ncbi:MAG: hypothetical protein H6819_07925 [Phycisphaerales bacterium]|nr:hypothetical protein [Phycisphaerales bacterium]MCB9854297.1 hypothetical protein [Phycisphaerales bacterium]MCB9863498.1 hypothetical protein [Phycisphaerales bacterium]
MNRRYFRAIIAGLAFAFAATGCDHATIPQEASADASSGITRVSMSPVETALHIQKLRWDRDYASVERFMTEPGRSETIRLLKSVDVLLDAHDRLQNAAKDRYGDQIHRAWNISAMRNNLGVFSRDVTIINQTMKGDTAYVTIQESDRVPLVRAEFNRVDGVWKLTPPYRDTSICGPLSQFATCIDKVADKVRAGLSPEGYFDAVTNELLPGMAQVAYSGSLESRRLAESAQPD